MFSMFAVPGKSKILVTLLKGRTASGKVISTEDGHFVSGVKIAVDLRDLKLRDINNGVLSLNKDSGFSLKNWLFSVTNNNGIFIFKNLPMEKINPKIWGASKKKDLKIINFK